MTSASTGNKKNARYKAALFGAALIWGSSFFIVKNTVDVFPSNILLGFRFSIGCALLALIFHKKFRLFDRAYLWRGAALGVLLFCAYCFQTIGINYTTAGNNAFLTAVYCVLVPFFFWAVDKTRPDRFNFLAAVLCIAGIGLVSLNGGFSIGLGDGLTLVGGVFYALHMVAVAKFTQGRDAILLTIIQFFFSAVCAWLVGLMIESFPAVSLWTADAVLGVMYLAVFATAIALLLQNVGQKHVNPAPASILLSLESVFGVLFSVIFTNEQVTPRLFCGFALIFVAVVTSETKLSFLFKKKKNLPAQEAQREAA